MEENATSRAEYVRRILAAYRSTPGTTGQIRREDRRLAVQLYEKGVHLDIVENALVLAAARRLFRPPDAARLATIRSLHYFLPVIEEVAELTVGQDYFRYLRGKVERFLEGPESASNSKAADFPCTPHAFGVDDIESPSSTLVPNPVSREGHFRRALLGHFSRAPRV